MGKPWKLVLCLIGIFLAGAVTGGLVTWRVNTIKTQRRTIPGQWAPWQLQRYVRSLGLTLDQEKAIRPIVEQAGQEMSQARRQAFDSVVAIQNQMVADVIRQLTPEQRAKLEALQKRKQEQFEKWQAEHRRQHEERVLKFKERQAAPAAQPPPTAPAQTPPAEPADSAAPAPTIPPPAGSV